MVFIVQWIQYTAVRQTHNCYEQARVFKSSCLGLIAWWLRTFATYTCKFLEDLVCEVYMSIAYERTVDQNFQVKNDLCNKFINKFLWFHSICGIFLTIDSCNMNKCLVYYQVSGEPGIASYSHRWDIHLGSVDLLTSLFIDHHRLILFFAVCLHHEIILTVKFSWTTVVTFWGIVYRQTFGYLCKFSPQHLWLWCLLMAPEAICKSFLHENCIFNQFAKVFFVKSFPLYSSFWIL